MNVYNSPYDVKNSYSTLKEPLNASVVSSIVGHLIVLFLIIFGIPFVAHNPEVIFEPIPVEVISSADLNKSKPPQEPPAEVEPPPMKKQAPTLIEPEPVIEEVVPEKRDVLLEPAPPPPPIETPDSEVEKDIEPEKPIILPTRKPTPPKKAVEKPKEEVKPKKDLSAILKNLAETEPAKPVTTSETAAENSPQKGIAAGQLSFSEMDAVRAQISGCWNFPAGAKYAENLVVELQLVMNTDRTVRNAKVSNMGKYNSDPAYRAAADAAMRAVRNPRCDPLNLPPAKYSEWKTITLNFDPRGML